MGSRLAAVNWKLAEEYLAEVGGRQSEGVARHSDPDHPSSATTRPRLGKLRRWTSAATIEAHPPRGGPLLVVGLVPGVATR